MGNPTITNFNVRHFSNEDLQHLINIETEKDE